MPLILCLWSFLIPFLQYH
uniref:Uncharacterized protein n=1 Tax=Rhizophora mucronata TaxID=61149 RepID=A0A2P2LAC4_RHIMU